MNKLTLTFFLLLLSISLMSQNWDYKGVYIIYGKKTIVK